jgi:putative endonuclease
MSRSASQRRRDDQRGRAAESLAALYLRLKGHRILGRRLRTPMGEIDILARKGDMLVFVEVKLRTTLDTGTLALHPAARHRIARAARWLAPRYGAGTSGFRIDAVLIRPWGWPRHLVAAWGDDEGWT